MQTEETILQKIFHRIQAFPNLCCINLFHRRGHVLLLVFLSFSILAPVAGQNPALWPVSPTPLNASDVTLHERASNTDGEKSITDPSPYCLAHHDNGGIYGSGNYINIVKLGTIENVNSGHCAGPHYYIYYNDMETDLIRGQEYEVTVDFGKPSGILYYGEITVWIDFNGNSIFDHPGEKLGSILRGDNFRTITFTVPCDAKLGKTRMRVREYRGSNSHYDLKPCENAGYGETEDYNINVVEVPQPAVSISASANSVCEGSNVTFTATPTNGGTAPKYQWKINGNNVGSNSSMNTFTTGSLTNGQVVTCVMTVACTPPVTSNAIVMEVGQEIGNNTLDLSNGVYGTVCATADEYSNAYLAAPAGCAFVHVAFASYGTPKGSCNNFSFGNCHSALSFPVTETYLLGKNSASIPATNTVFGDPCVGTVKKYYVQAVYAQPTCQGTSPGQITGTLPTGGIGTFTYLWESSTTSATAGFAAASGINNQRNYTPGNLNQTTWFRRTVYSGGCESISRVMVIYVTPAITNNNISASQAIGAGEIPASLNGSLPAGGVGGYTYLWEKSTTSATSGFSLCSGINNSRNYSPPALSQTTWFRRVVNSGVCTDVSAAVQITVTHFWKGTLSTDFATAGNWISNSVPAPGGNIQFAPLVLRHCMLDGPRTVGNVTNAQPDYRFIANGHTLTIQGDLIFTNGAQIEAGSSSSTLKFAGTAIQNIPAGAVFNNEVYNLTVDNLSNVALLGALNIRGVLLLTKGVLYTNNNLTLLSTAEQTALIDGSGMGQVSGDVTMQRYLPKGFGYKYLSSPMQNATVAQLGDDMDLSASFPTFYTYDESKTSSGWNSYIIPASPLLPLVGYCVNFGANPASTMADITGKVNNGTMGPLGVFNHNMQFTRGFNLVGNPYPSPIDWSAVNGWSKINIDNAVYYFNAGDTNQYTGTYSSYINGISSDGVASEIIPSMQGFFVHVSDGIYPVSGSIQVNNQARVNNLSPAFHKNAEWDSRPLIRLNAKFEGQQTNKDFLAIYFDPNATGLFEKELDALKIFNTDVDVPNLFAISEDERRLSIGAWPQPYETLEIPLAIQTERSGNITLRLDNQANIPIGYSLYLRDKATGAVQDLSRVPVYSLPAGKGLMEGRLSLVISSSDISQGSFGNNSFNVYAQDGWLFVNIQLKEIQANLRLTNMAGQVLLQRNIYGEGTHRLSSSPPPGVYLVTVYTDQGILSQKIYLQ